MGIQQSSNLGLNYNTSISIEIQKTMANMTIDAQALYADPVCVGLINDVTWLNLQLQTLTANPNYPNWTTTMVGSCAYIVLHPLNDDIKQKATNLWNGYMLYAK